jgi:hypothetical protein
MPRSAIGCDEVATSRLTNAEMLQLFGLLNKEMAGEGKVGELYLVGGAVMCLAFGARDSTKDVDAVFEPARVVREAAARVAIEAGVAQDWLNDAVKGFLGTRGEFDRFLDLSHLQIFVAQPAYLLAMKCAALRLGEEFHDLDDVCYLLRHLNITSAEAALAVVTRYFDEKQLQPKTRLILESLFE